MACFSRAHRALFGSLAFSVLAAVSPLAAEDFDREPIRWLREYLQIDTTNPPGNEAEAVEFLAAILEAEGLEAQRLVSPGERTSLLARWSPPSSRGSALVLLHHIDVVAAGEPWRQPPFSGRPVDGKIWGRGALDVKGLGIVQLATLVELVRQDVDLPIDLVYLAVADEEAGGLDGAGWLLEAHPELFEGVAAVLNEGGSNRVVNDRLVWWGIEVAQKRPLWLSVTAHGRAGHASGLNPASATHQLIRGLARVVERPLEYRVTDAARTYLGALARLEGDPRDHLFYRLDEVIQPDGPTIPLSPGLPSYFVDTIQVTEIRNGRGGNVIAPRATARIDVRMLPDTDGEALLAEIRELLGPQLEVEVLLTSPESPPAPTRHPVFQALESALGLRGPVVPTFMTGTTDSRFFRQRGIPAYGFSPFSLNADDLRGIHALDESIPADELLRGIVTLRRVVLEIGEALPPG